MGTKVAVSGTVRRDKVLRAAAVGLVLYGLFGLALLLLGFSIVWQTFAGIDQLRGSLSGQSLGLVGALRATSTTLDSTATGFDNVGKTLADAQASSAQAAGLARGLSRTMGDLAGAAQVPVLGFQPFGQLGKGFSQASGQMLQLGDDLDRTSQSLGQNGADIRAIKANLAEVRAQLDRVVSASETTALLGGSPADLWPLKLALYGLLLWLAGLALISILLGLALFDHQQRRIRAHHPAARALPDPDPAIPAPRDQPSDAA
jgi:hypothetical protein